MSTGSGHFAILGSDFAQIFGQIISIRIKTLSNTNLAASRLIKREKTSLPVDVCRPKLGSLSNSVFERRTSTRSGLFVSLGSGLVETLGLIVFIREKKLSNTNLLASRKIKRERAHFRLTCVAQKRLCLSSLMSLLRLVRGKHLIRLREYRDSRETKLTK